MRRDTASLTRAAVHRIACAVVAAEVRRIREADLPAPLRYDWPETMPIGATGVGLDSLEQLGALGALGETFDLDANGPDRAPPEHVGDWVDWIAGALDGHGGRITVSTSGSTGVPRPCVHSVADLLNEAAFWAEQCRDRRRVVALVPAQHLYGMIWTALLPGVLGLPVYIATIGGPLRLEAGDLIVAVPEQWQALRRLTRTFPDGILGASSAAPLDDRLMNDLLCAGLDRLIDVYGSSETSAIGMRDAPGSPYDLLPRWRLAACGHDDWQLLDRDGTVATLPDHIERIGERQLRPAGRRDGAVQVGGHNVWPERVAQMLREAEGVADAAVRLSDTGRLKAFIVPQPYRDVAALAARIEGIVAAHHPDHERPKSVSFGSAAAQRDGQALRLGLMRMATGFPT